MSLEDSLTLADAYKLPTAQINYLYLIQLIGHGKVCLSVRKHEIDKFEFCIFLMHSWHVGRKSFVLLADWGMHDSSEEAVLCRGGVCGRASHILGKAAAGGQSPHIWRGEEREDGTCSKSKLICILGTCGCNFKTTEVICCCISRCFRKALENQRLFLLSSKCHFNVASLLPLTDIPGLSLSIYCKSKAKNLYMIIHEI